ncbi:primase homolog protein isoform X1 [Sesamum indicum]|uniref:Primase homolog protein isoform X1 n=1 Tax=Sesamum indicum TaxID=4182 RepID=A0A6I9UAN2_SESIN|nr:primase homolog protein isoform X1 [Sesamum indicum]
MPLQARLRAPLFQRPCLLAPNTSSDLPSIDRPNNFLLHSLQSLWRISLRSNGFRSFCNPRSAKPTVKADVGEEEGEEEEGKTAFAKLKQKIEALGINSDSCTPGVYDHLYCPKCKGGKSIHRSLSFHINRNWSYALWRCFNLQCGWAGKVFADTKKAYPVVGRHGKLTSSWPLTMESLRLQMLGNELLAYFAERMISKETLERNKVMQVAGDQKIIAFTYRQNGHLVGCKYRTIEKRYWQERNTEKYLYGLDDIAEADEIIIVEGEIDKLSLEEAGYCNCVSVPSGAPQTVSLKEIPSPEKDTRFQYLWNCEDYLDKASRIILATDGDVPGQSLAEELARRLGRERCWRVHWPKKDEANSFKDANEVLEYLGADALRDAIDNAELYQMQSLD